MGDSDFSYLENDPNWRTIKRSSLESGNVLRCLIHQAKVDDSYDNKFSMYSCIRDSTFIIPFEGGSEFPSIDPEKVKPGDEFTLEEDVHLRPAYLRNDAGDRFLPMFTNEKQLAGQFEDCRIHLSMCIEDCVDTAKKFGMDLIIDAFTNQLYIPIDLAEHVSTMPTRLID